MAGAFSGFLVVAPVLATGLYALSRALERGEPANMALVLHTWWPWRQPANTGSTDGIRGERRALEARTRRDTRPVRFGLLLALAGTGWVLTSAALITLLAPQPILKPMDFVHHVVLARDNYLFEIWLALGGVLAAPVFASSAIAMPLLVDRPVGVLQAVLTSWRAVLANPVPLALWAALIMGLTLLGLATLLVGLVVLVPLLGHASWHAYRALVLPQDTPAAESAP